MKIQETTAIVDRSFEIELNKREVNFLYYSLKFFLQADESYYGDVANRGLVETMLEEINDIR